MAAPRILLLPLSLDLSLAALTRLCVSASPRSPTLTSRKLRILPRSFSDSARGIRFTGLVPRRALHVSLIVLSIACAAARGAIASPAVAIGKGGADGFVATAADGTIHVIFDGRYRSGPTPDRLGPEEKIADVGPVNGVRIAVDARGRPHVVFTTGTTARATRSYYTARIDGRWLPAEKFADIADFPERERAYVADVAVDEESRVLVSFWVSRPDEKRAQLDNPSFHYRWRMRDGAWSPPRSLPAHWSSAAKVEYDPGRGFFLLWQVRNNDWRITGPVAAGGEFTVAQGFPTGSATLTGLSNVQNEGADFFARGGVLIAAGNVREKFEGPVGVWAAFAEKGAFTAATYLGSFPDTKRGNESGLHPVIAYDAATGAAFVTVLAASDKRACYSVFRRETGWQRGYHPILPDRPAPQGTLRQGPSVADIPGPGVVALARDGENNWYLRTLTVDASQ